MFWIVGGVVFALSIIGLPLTRAVFEMAKISWAPFGKDVVHVRELDAKGVTAITATTGNIGFIANVIWILTFGWIVLLTYILAGILNCLTLIGIPLGLHAFKLTGISFWPVGRRVVSIELANIAREENAREKLAKLRE